MGEIVLITGGARSGKSSYALDVCEQLGAKRLFVATCPNLDSEMNERVDRHKKEREGRGWVTIEETMDLTRVFQQNAHNYEVMLLDCITLWVNNILFSWDEKKEELNDFIIKERTSDWLKVARKIPGTLVCVTNEVGLGIVPDNALARKYRDLVGTVNQTIGNNADEVVLVSCGVPMHLKK